jgi:hypothetical protein
MDVSIRSSNHPYRLISRFLKTAAHAFNRGPHLTRSDRADAMHGPFPARRDTHEPSAPAVTYGSPTMWDGNTIHCATPAFKSYTL